MANYIQIEIGGKLRGWKVNQLTLEIWSNKTSAEFSNSSSNYAAVYAGLVSNCYVKSEEPDFTFEDVCDWVEEMNNNNDLTVLELIKKTFEESQAYIATLDRLNARLIKMKPVVDEDKKKRKAG